MSTRPNESTDHDENRNALEAFVAAWSASDKSYFERVQQLSIGGVGSASQFRLNTTTVHDDGVVDIVSGSTGLDWFFTNLANENPDETLGETVNDPQ